MLSSEDMCSYSLRLDDRLRVGNKQERRLDSRESRKSNPLLTSTIEFNTYDGHLFFVKHVEGGKHCLAQFTTTYSHRFYHIGLRLSGKK